VDHVLLKSIQRAVGFDGGEEVCHEGIYLMCGNTSFTATLNPLSNDARVSCL
jgi:hypothetical protein